MSEDCFCLRVTPDRMEAWLDFSGTPSADRDREAIARALAEAGVTFGIFPSALASALDGAAAGVSILVASGDPLIEGSPGSIQRLVDPVRAAARDARMDGSVDPHQAGSFVRVRKGQRVLRHVRPRPGIAGRDLSGHPLPAHLQPDCPFPEAAGLEPDPDYSEFLVAAQDGVLVEVSGRLEVRAQLVVPGDVGPATGAIDFPGPVTVKGSILAGFQVLAGGGLQVGGSVEASVVRVQGDLVVKEGILGGEGASVHVSGSVSARHAENAWIECEGDLDIQNTAMNCTLTAGGSLRVRGNLVSGSAVACRGVEVGEAGSPIGIPLRIRLGWPLSACREFQQIAAERRQTEALLADCESRRQRARKAVEAERLAQELDRARASLDAMALRERRLEEKASESLPDASVAVARVLHGDVRISIGMDTLRVEDDLRGPLKVTARNLLRIACPVALWVSPKLLGQLQKDLAELGYLNRRTQPGGGQTELDWPPNRGILCLEPSSAGEAGLAHLKETSLGTRRKILLFATREGEEDRKAVQGLAIDAWVEAPGGKLARDWAQEPGLNGIL